MIFTRCQISRMFWILICKLRSPTQYYAHSSSSPQQADISTVGIKCNMLASVAGESSATSLSVGGESDASAASGAVAVALSPCDPPEGAAVGAPMPASAPLGSIFHSSGGMSTTAYKAPSGPWMRDRYRASGSPCSGRCLRYEHCLRNEVSKKYRTPEYLSLIHI